MRQQRARRGMTFLEIMVVVTILSVMAIFTIPAMRGPHAFNKLRAGAREIVSLTRLARSTAVLNEVMVTLELDVDNDQYRLNLENLEAKKHLAERKALQSREEAIWRPLPDGVMFQEVHSWDDPLKRGNIARIVFYADGSASDSTIVLASERGRQMSVQLNRATGLAEVVKGGLDAADEEEE